MIWQPTIDEYHADSAVSHSSLEQFRSDRWMYAGIRAGRYGRETTVAMRESSVVHTALLEPERFRANSVLIPPSALTSNGQRRGNAWLDFQDEHPGKFLLLPRELEQIVSMQAAVDLHKQARILLVDTPGDVEYSVKWTDAETGLALRARFDKIFPERGVLVDLKTVESASPEAFARSVETYGYHRQEAFYRAAALASLGLTDIVFLFVVVEKEPPYACAVYELDAEWVQRGHAENVSDLRALAECQATGVWTPPGHGTVVKLSSPKWAK